jgi:cytoskeletal protein CcmA (bactofilin family)
MDDSKKNEAADDSKSLDGNTGSIDTTSTDALNASSGSTGAPAADPNSGTKKKGFHLPGPLQKYGHRFNIYLLFFILIIVVAGSVLIITALAAKQTKDPSAINSQNLSSDAVNQLNNTSTTVGDPKQVLNIQSNSVFSGKVLVKDSLEVVGQIKVGGPLSLPGITVSGESNFDQLNVNKSLTIGGDASVQGQLNVKKNIAVSGTGTFGGAFTAPQISTSSLQLLGDLTLTRHIVAGGANPGRGIGGAVGAGGTSSVSGSDTAGTVNINTGSSPSAGCFITVNFVTRYTATPRVLVTPVGSDAGSVQMYVNRNSSSFSICSANIPPANTSFGYDYFVLN